jgi:F-type H+-transporting ATPase subunit delta
MESKKNFSMSLDVKLAKDYARSLLADIKGISKQDQILNHLVVFNEFMQSNEIVRRSLYSPIIDKSAKIRLADSIADQYKFEQIFKQFLHVLIKNARCNLLPQIILAIKKIVAETKGIKLVEVTSAYDLTNKEQKTIQEFLEKKIGCSVEVTFFIDPLIIGGVVIKYDSNLIDCSVDAGLRKIEDMVTKLRV